VADNEFSQGVSETTDLAEETGRRLSEAAQRGISEVTDLVDTTGRRLTEAAQRGASDTIDRAEATGRRLNQAAEGMLDDALRTYQTFFNFQGAKRMAEAYIAVNERMMKESLESARRLIELWFDGARRWWQVAEEGRRDVTSGD
jgi:hypothetical protein